MWQLKIVCTFQCFSVCDDSCSQHNYTLLSLCLFESMLVDFWVHLLFIDRIKLSKILLRMTCFLNSCVTSFSLVGDNITSLPKTFSSLRVVMPNFCFFFLSARRCLWYTILRHVWRVRVLIFIKHRWYCCSSSTSTL